jgi:hypothetical protein
MEPFFELNKSNLNISKKLEKYLDGANIIHYHFAKLQYKISSILDKNTKKIDLGGVNSVAFFLPKFVQFVFFMIVHSKVFRIENLQDRSV